MQLMDMVYNSMIIGSVLSQTILIGRPAIKPESPDNQLPYTSFVSRLGDQAHCLLPT